MKKNLMFIIPQLIGGGAEKTVANLSKSLIKKYNVYIVIFYESEKKYEYSGELIHLFSNKKNKILKKIDMIKRLRKLKKELKIDCSISFLRNADIINILTFSKEKKMLSVRNKESVESITLWNKFKVYFTCKMCDKVIAISKQVKDDLVTNFHIKDKKITTIYNPCIIEENYKKIDVKFKKKNNIVTVGRLTRQKGQWHLIRAMSQVVKEEPDTILYILGVGDLEDYLKKLVKDYNLENNIEFLGFVNPPYDYIKESNLFVLPSLYEGLGNSLMEAMLCGRPVLATDYDSGAREILAPKTDYKVKVTNTIDYCEYGVLVPVCDGNMYSFKDELTKEELLMAEAILDLLRDKKKNKLYKEKSIERSKDFSIDNISNQWLKEIE